MVDRLQEDRDGAVDANIERLASSKFIKLDGQPIAESTVAFRELL